MKRIWANGSHVDRWYEASNVNRTAANNRAALVKRWGCGRLQVLYLTSLTTGVIVFARSDDADAIFELLLEADVDVDDDIEAEEGTITVYTILTKAMRCFTWIWYRRIQVTELETDSSIRTELGWRFGNLYEKTYSVLEDDEDVQKIY